MSWQYTLKERKALDLLLFHFAAFYCVDNCSALCLLSVFRSSFLVAITLYPEHTSTLVERGKKRLHSTAELFCRQTLWYLKTTDQPSALTYYKYCQRELINSSVKWCYTGHFFLLFWQLTTQFYYFNETLNKRKLDCGGMMIVKRKKTLIT